MKPFIHNLDGSRLVMGRERKNQLGTSNLSARIENSSLGSSSTIKTNDISTNNPPSPSSFTKVTKSLTRSLIAPDDYVDPNKKTKRVSVNKTATWKPAAIYERDFSTDHTSSFTDPKRYVEPLAPAKSTYEIAEEQLQVKAQKGALDDLCKLIRTTYGTAATMMRSVSFKWNPILQFVLISATSSLIRRIVITLISTNLISTSNEISSRPTSQRKNNDWSSTTFRSNITEKFP